MMGCYRCSLVVIVCLAAGCGDNVRPRSAPAATEPDAGETPPGNPFDSIAVAETIEAPGLGAPVDVVRDEFGVAHIRAENIADLAFANGYIQAEDRLQQMDLFRHAASGTMAELFGAINARQIDNDLAARIHRLRPVAEQVWQTMMASSDPLDREMVQYLERFAAGINHYAADLEAGRRAIDPALASFFKIENFEPWTPVDTLTIVRFQAHSLAFDDGDELELTERYSTARTVFDQADPTNDPDLLRRAGAGYDLFPLTPADQVATIDGFPGVPSSAAKKARRAELVAAGRPEIPRQTLAAALRTLRTKSELARRLLSRDNGSNNWVVGPARAGGKTLLASDPHLDLGSPTIFYLTHLTVPGDLDVTGVTFPGIPGVLLGHNGHIAWGGTNAKHDVNDYYVETIVSCSGGSGDCVMHNGQEVAIETRQEVVRVGALGTITDSKTVTYEYVPHHGPIIPTIENHDVVPRTGSSALSVRYTGHEPTNELRAFFGLWRARSRAEAFTALQDFDFGNQSWGVIDDAGSFGFISNSLIPLRTPGCFTFNSSTAPDGVAPFLTVPGDGTCEWDGFMAEANVPHAIEPSVGYVGTANGDLVGELFDGDPLNGPVVDGHTLYAGAFYNIGFRTGRMHRLLQAKAASGQAMTVNDMAEMQADTHGNFAERLRPHILAATSDLAEEIATPGTHSDLQTWVAGLSAAQRQALTDAASRLQNWTLATPAAVRGTPGAGDIADSVATAIFNIWTVHFMRASVGDELAALDPTEEPARPQKRTILTIFENPGDLHSGLAPETNEPVLCDDLATTGTVESCTLIVLMSLDAALAWAAGTEGFDTADADQWRWGKLHTITLSPQVPAGDLRVPAPDESDPLLANGFPRPGDGDSLDAARHAYDDLDFTYDHGPALRQITALSPDGDPVTRIALPGGNSSRRDTDHFRDLMDRFWLDNQYFDLPWTTGQIVDSAETRWRFVAGD